MGRCSRFVRTAAVVILLAACTGGGGDGKGTSASPKSQPWHGGSLRLALVEDAFWRLDPQREYHTGTFELFRCCLLRTLFSYNGLPVSEGGAEARPDLAAGKPEISADGLTWTIRIRPGIHYAPPLEDVEITAQDFLRALMREASPDVKASYAFYYSVIEGFDAFASGDAEAISGVETPDEHTLVIRLTAPTGDLANRLAMAAMAPIPPNPHRPDAPLGAAEGHDRTYGRFLVASGPYMIEGAQDLDLSLQPADHVPIAGYSPTRRDEDGNVVAAGSLTLVRNPSWDAATDDLRGAYADRIEVQLMGDGYWEPASAAAFKELAAGIAAGTVDSIIDPFLTPGQRRRLQADPALGGRIIQLPTGLIRYIVMKVAVPPLDDVHVRRAIAFAIDRAELQRTLIADPATRPSLGTAEQVAATHIAPDGLEGNLLAGYDPYPASLEQARREMALSRYDTDGDGRCDAPECNGVRVDASSSFGSAGTAQVAAALEAIGIRIHLRVEAEGWSRVPSARWAIALPLAAAPDYPNAFQFFQMFDSSTIGYFNASLVGATPSQLRAWGFEVTKVTSVDDRIDRCMGVIGLDQTECWADLDRYLMEQVVPWIPIMAGEWSYVVSERVATSSPSVSTGTLAIDRFSLVPGSE